MDLVDPFLPSFLTLPLVLKFRVLPIKRIENGCTITYDMSKVVFLLYERDLGYSSLTFNPLGPGGPCLPLDPVFPVAPGLPLSPLGPTLPGKPYLMLEFPKQILH